MLTARGVCSEYDFYNFNTINSAGNVTVHTLVAPTLNSLDPSRPVAVAVSVDSLAPQTTYFIPPAAPGSLPPQWDGNDGFAVRTLMFAIHTVRKNADVLVGEHHRRHPEYLQHIAGRSYSQGEFL